MQKIVIILPTYNERENIQSIIVAIETVCKSLKNVKTQILVVDDYSPDKTAEIVTRLEKKYTNLKLISKQKEGLGAAITYGMEYAKTHYKPDILMQMDADWSHNPQLIPQFLEKINQGADFVIGSRYITGGSIPGNWGLQRKLYSVIGNLWVRLGLGQKSPHDWSSGYRMMRSGVMEKVLHGLSKYSGYLFQIAFLHRVKTAGFQVAEVPLVFVDRIHGKSKFPAVEYIKSVSLYVINNSTIIKYLCIGVAGFALQTVVAKLLVLLAVNPGLAVGIGSFFAIVSNFLGNNLWTFSHQRIHGLTKLLKKFVHFFLTSIGAVIIQGVVVGVGVLFWHSQNAWFYLMVFAIVFLVIPFNFFVYNRFIWKTHEKAH